MERVGRLSSLLRVLGRRRGNVARRLDRMTQQLDGPHPPQRLTFSCSYGAGTVSRVEADVAAVKQLMKGRPYELVREGIGTEAELIVRGVLDGPRHGSSHDPRAPVGYLRYVRRP